MRRVRNRTQGTLAVNLDTLTPQGSREEVYFGPRGAEDDTLSLSDAQWGSTEIQKLLTKKFLENRR